MTSTPPVGGWAYGLLGWPLAFAALPLYVVLPDHYARQLAVPLAPLGLTLLGVRLLDAWIDPWIGRQVDAWFAHPRRLRGMAWGMAGGLALAFTGLFFPPMSWHNQPVWLLAWAAGMLMLCSLAHSGLTVLHQAWGARQGGDATQRTRIVAWREGWALLGVMGASVLPATLGLEASTGALAIGLGLGMGLLWQQPWPQPIGTGALSPPSWRTSWAPLTHAPLRRLLGVYGLNGLASALPATLVLFFIRDRLAAPEATPWLLTLYFGAAALSLPLWVRVVSRIGLVGAWGAGMALAVAGFVSAARLGAGDVAAFAAVCLVCGLAQGADLSVPPALLAGLLRRAGRAGQAEGLWFGWWQFTGKLSLALAAGTALPLLASLGYQPGQPDVPPATALGWTPLVLGYAVWPCVLKSMAGGLLWWLSRDPAFQPSEEPLHD
jgi:glycoside/pentoside/hexuronide:cation symporter, GPH family